MIGTTARTTLLLPPDLEYPTGLRAAANDGSEPPDLLVLGEPDLLQLALTGIVASRSVPPDLVLPALDLVRDLRDAGTPLLGGFHTPLERACLQLLLAGRSPVVVCPARHPGVKLPITWRAAVEAGRLAVALPLRAGQPLLAERRASVRDALFRNGVVCGLADRIVVVHARPGSRTFDLARRALDMGRVVDCLDSPANRDLALVGAGTLPVRLSPAGRSGGRACRS